MKSILLHTCAAPISGYRNTVRKAFVLLGWAAALVVNPAAADPAADVSRLLKAGQHKEALYRADAFLAQRPRDAQMRFLKGVILTEQNKSAEAINIFSRLTQDFPDLPEPYNNLAVLYAADGEYEKARVVLDKAIRTNPAYSTAYENLGDIHAKLASQAYDKALQLDSSNTATKSKLTLVRGLVPSTTTTVAAAVPTAPAAPAKKPAQDKQPPMVVAKAPNKPEPQPEAKPEPKTVKPEGKSDAKLNAKPESKPAAKPAAKPTASDAEQDAVMAAINGWAEAWSARDVKGYLNAYANGFETPGGQSRSAWAKERQARIVGKGRIDIKIEQPKIQVKGNTATVKFRQIYLSDRLTANTRKTLVLTRQGGKWLILQERTGS